MRFADIRSALIQSWLDGDFELDTAYPNKKFDPAAGTPWAAVFILPNQPEVATLGDRGEDVHDGVFQISLFYPPDEGDAAIMAKADAVATHYKAGNRYTYDGQGVLVRSCGRSQGRLDDGWYRIDLTMNWQSHVSRAAPAPSCTITLTAPGDLSTREPMTIDGQTVSAPDGEDRVAETESHAFPTGMNAVVAEVHYNPADWVGGSTGGSRVSAGDVTTGDEVFVQMSDEGQATDALAVLALLESESESLYFLDREGNIMATGSVDGLNEYKIYIVSGVAGAEATIVTDSSQFVCDLSALTGAGYNQIDWCDDEI